MRQQEFEQRYQKDWLLFEENLALAKALPSKRRKNSHKLKNYEIDYRLVCYCLSLAKERQYSPYLIQKLESLVFQGHQIFYQKKIGIIYQIYRFILFGFPIAVRQQIKFVWIASLLFYLPGLFIFWIVLVFPEIIYAVVDSGAVANIESMYDPALDKLGRERQSDTDFMMFGHYIRNNIGIAFQEFAGGILATLGTLFYLIYNGIFFGAISAHIINVGYQQTFFPFVAGHSSYELTGIVLAAAAGLQLGWAIISPGNYSRKQALINAGQKAMILVYGAILLLLIAALVEAFWSSSNSISVITKYSVGIGGWVMVIAYLSLMGRGRG